MSSSVIPRPFFIFLSIIFIGKGFKISKNLNNIKEVINQPINGRPSKKIKKASKEEPTAKKLK